MLARNLCTKSAIGERMRIIRARTSKLDSHIQFGRIESQREITRVVLGEIGDFCRY